MQYEIKIVKKNYIFQKKKKSFKFQKNKYIKLKWYQFDNLNVNFINHLKMSKIIFSKTLLLNLS